MTARTAPGKESVELIGDGSWTRYLPWLLRPCLSRWPKAKEPGRRRSPGLFGWLTRFLVAQGASQLGGVSDCGERIFMVHVHVDVHGVVTVFEGLPAQAAAKVSWVSVTETVNV